MQSASSLPHLLQQLFLPLREIRRQLHVIGDYHVAYRSVATVTLHLNSAMQKLGAKNRVQAVVRAVHYRLLDSECSH